MEVNKCCDSECDNYILEVSRKELVQITWRIGSTPWGKREIYCSKGHTYMYDGRDSVYDQLVIALDDKPKRKD